MDGLQSNPKTLPSKYFYDKKGDQLFVQIMALPEYYLTRAEHEILREQTAEIVEVWKVQKDEHFELLELGAGDGQKTKEILRFLTQNKFKFSYRPIDISQHALDALEGTLESEIPELDVSPLQGDYFGVLSKLSTTPTKKIVLFLGSNMGNMSDDRATSFMQSLSNELNEGDVVFIGLDKIKAKEVVLPAYNDKQGVTSAFNLNLLTRINRELGADFNLKKFEHAPEYDPATGIAKSFIRSTADQVVTIKENDSKIEFKSGEKIHTEISRKYNDEILLKILEPSCFEIKAEFNDSQSLFGDFVLRRSKA